MMMMMIVIIPVLAPARSKNIDKHVTVSISLPVQRQINTQEGAERKRGKRGREEAQHTTETRNEKDTSTSVCAFCPTPYRPPSRTLSHPLPPSASLISSLTHRQTRAAGEVSPLLSSQHTCPASTANHPATDPARMHHNDS